jgi:hypothetical protein
MSATLTRRAAGDPDRILAAPVRAPVEPAEVPEDLEACLLDQPAPFLRREPRELHRRRVLGASHRERQASALGVPLGALEDARLPFQPAAVRLGYVAGAGREDVERELAARHEQPMRRGERSQARLVRVEVQIRAEGTRDERDALWHRRIGEVPEAEVDEFRDACRRGGLSAHLEHPARRVDPDHRHAGGSGRDRDASGAHAELDDAAGLFREVDVEADVLGHAHRPGVVDPCDLVVGAHA